MRVILASLLIVVTLAISSTNAGFIDANLRSALSSGGNRDVMIAFPSVLNQVLGSSALSPLTGEARSNEIIPLVQLRTSAAQLPVLNTLTSLGLRDQATPFWAANRIALRNVGLGPLATIAAIPGPFVIREAKNATIYPVAYTEEINASQVRTLRQASGGKAQWGVAKINAPAVWESGNTGEGVVVGIIDTGVNVDHEALKSSYKNDKYSWFDAFGEYPDSPHDGNQHGTHCTGTIAGTMNGIGVAPGAKWIACRGLNDEGSGNESTLIGCGQFMACPNNSTGSCTGFPNIVSNSWGGLVGGSDFYNEIISLWQSLKIIPIFALGNSGPGCPTAGSPGDQNNLISVGSTDEDDSVSKFSSRGPSVTSGAIKPEVSAPGGKIVSASHDSNDGYRKLSGTSMACPHVAGTAALILSANPKLDYNGVKKALEETTFKKPLTAKDAPLVCSWNLFMVTYPNNGYGHGRVDAKGAVDKVKQSRAL